MKKVIYLIAALITFSTVVKAQNDPKAEAILDAMSKKYQNMSGFKANFTSTMENPERGIKESASGEIVVKGGKFNLKMGGQEIINNGKTVWTYTEEANEVLITNYEPDEDDITPTNIFSMYKNGYKYILMSEINEGGKTYNVVDLEPTERQGSIYKIRLVIAKDDNTIRSWKVYDKDGTQYNYVINSIQHDYKADDSMFSFDKSKHKGVKEEDLR
ncbi:outer membrane lipoprotein carrier protein LolA [Cytophagaceae bacterium ABcell3]|nr:outer membrane lipoprotein carrier protein LolA [Cytophagaceae bacterium ABcell3]